MLRVILNTFNVLRKKKGFLLLSIVLPAMLIILFSYVLGQEGEYRVGIVNKDNGIISNSVLGKIESIDGIKIEEIKEEDSENLLAGKELELVIIVNDNFTKNILSGKIDNINVKSVSESDVKPVIIGVLNSETNNLQVLSKLANGDEIKFKELEEKYNNNMPEYKLNDSKEKRVSIMSSIGIIIMMILISGQVIVRFIIDEEVNGTKARTLLSGVSEKSYSAGIFTVFYLCSALTSVVYYGICKVLGFNFGLDNSIYFLIILLLVNLLAVTFNLCIVSCTKNPSLASNISVLFIIPTSMLSGSFWGFSMMPDYMQKIGNICPQRWAIGAIEKLQSGKSLVDVAPMLLSLVILSLALFLLSIFFSSKVEDRKC
ncbi:ABC transporter permease [Clostridium gasigenes]|uniref:ABC transporter permease n=1 Tax=Clostridium gasigenes TaxID=94869 RepID=UPI001C0D9331|nr:ABC transporter permease [Clostridium gasigenes]MBU3103499.1 ABC transporter permease [Clostridium gasigenes]